MPAATGFSGVDIRLAGGSLVFRASLKDSTGAKVITGTTSLRIYELQDNGTLKTFDWGVGQGAGHQYTFQSGVLGTETQDMSIQKAANNATNTGIWTWALSTLTGFTPSAIYIAQVTNSGASPESQEREFQFSGSIECLVQHSGKAQAGAAGTITLAGTASSTTGFYVGAVVVPVAGAGAGQGGRSITAYNGSTKIATIGRNWVTGNIPDATTMYVVINLTVPRVNDSLQAYADVESWLGATAPSITDGSVKADIVKIGGTTQTAGRDLGTVLPAVPAGAAGGVATTPPFTF